MNYEAKVKAKFADARCVPVVKDDNLEGAAFVVETEDDNIGAWMPTIDLAWISAYATSVNPKSDTYKSEVLKVYPDARLTETKPGLFIICNDGVSLSHDQATEPKAWAVAFDHVNAVSKKY